MIKGFYQGCLELAEEYKHDQEVPAARRQLLRLARPVILYLLWKPLRDFTHPFGPPSGLKGLLEGKQKSSGGIFDNIKYLILFSVKCKYVTRNTGNGRKNEDNTDSYETLRRNPYDSYFRASFRKDHPSALVPILKAKVDIFRKTISLEVGNEKDKILRDLWRKRFGNEYDDNEDFKDPDGCGESKENEILGTIINKLHDEWFKETHEDDDNLEGSIYYLKQTLYDGFIDSDDEEYKERNCRLLGMPYIKPPLILIEKVKVTRYSVGPGKVYTKIKVLKVEELSRTRGNIATIRAGIMEEIFGNDDEKEPYDETQRGHESNLKTR
ncbi:hypothetical protein Tco_0550831 [Tanacetum coccineum]